MTEHQARHAPSGLLRILGLAFGLAVVVGGMVGSGIMRAPGVVAQGITSPPLMLLAWALGGVAAAIAAMPLVEAGASVPLAGGAYPIARRAFGPTIGFVAGWISWLSYTGANGFISVVFGEYLHRLGIAPQLPVSVLAVLLIAVVGAINLTGTRVSGASQNLASAIKGAGILALAAILLLTRHAPAAAQPVAAAAAAGHGAVAGIAGAGALVMAIRVIVQTYAGWEGCIVFSEEVHQPEHNVARSAFGGIAAVTVLYVLVVAAVLHVLSPAAMAGSTLALGDAARAPLGAAADVVVTIMGLFSMAALVNLQVMITPRIAYAMAKGGALPPALTRVTRNGTPVLGVVVGVLGAAAIAATGSYEAIVRIYSPWNIGSILMVCLAAIALRIREPELNRPWKMPLYPWTAIFACLIQAALIAVVVWDDPVSGLWSAVVAFAPVPVYLAFAGRWRPALAKG
jgi:APA family basic amino acid/polyamine antiporter